MTPNKNRMGARTSVINPLREPALNPEKANPSAVSPVPIMPSTYSTLINLVVMKLVNDRSNSEDRNPRASASEIGRDQIALEPLRRVSA